MIEKAIETDGLTKRFGDFVAVESLDLEVEVGQVVALLGPNGAGKTTTVRMLATLLVPDGGAARVAGHDVVHEAARVRELISLTGQFAALDRNLTACENLILMARLRDRSVAEARQVADRLIERLDAGDFSDRLVKKLSGGERRRVDLATGLIDRPYVLVLDEPTTGLDPRSRQVVWTTICELVSDGVTLLLTTQYLEEADALADRVVLIDRGRLRVRRATSPAWPARSSAAGSESTRSRCAGRPSTMRSWRSPATRPAPWSPDARRPPHERDQHPITPPQRAARVLARHAAAHGTKPARDPPRARAAARRHPP